MKEEEPVDGKKSEDDGIEKENLAILEKIRKNQRQDHLNVSQVLFSQVHVWWSLWLIAFLIYGFRAHYMLLNWYMCVGLMYGQLLILSVVIKFVNDEWRRKKVKKCGSGETFCTFIWQHEMLPLK